MTTRRDFLGGLMGGGAAIALSACAPTTSTPAGAAPTKVPVKSTWTVAVGFPLPSLDLVGSLEASTGILGHFYESLTDTAGTEFKLVPRLAERWEKRDDRTTRFYLRKGVTYHNGLEFKAADVKFSYEEVYAVPTHAHNRYARWLDKVTVIDDYTVDISTKTPNNLVFLYDMGQLFVGAKANRAEELKTEKPIGTGPYMVDKWDKVTLTLKANPNYWRGKPQPEMLVIRSIADSTTSAAELVTGGVDIVRDIDLLQAAQLKKDPALEMLSFKGGTTDYSSISITKAPFTDRRVRQAINYGVDRQKLIDTVMLGFAVPLAGPFPKGFLGHDPNLKPYAYDPQKAKSLLAEAGFPNGFKTQWGLSLRAHPGSIYKQFWEATAGQLKAIGVELEVVPFADIGGAAGAAWCGAAAPFHLPINDNTWGVAADPSSYMSAAYGERPCQQQPRITALYEKANSAADVQGRGAALQELARAWQDEAMFLEIMAHDLVIGKRKDGVTYQIAPYGNSNAMHQWFDVASIKPLG